MAPFMVNSNTGFNVVHSEYSTSYPSLPGIDQYPKSRGCSQDQAALAIPYTVSTMATDLTAKKFLNRAGLSATPRVVDLFDSVRRIPYAVTGDRTAEGVVECWRGSCSGKHALLWLMLQHFGHEARIVTVETTVDSALPARSSVPAGDFRSGQRERDSGFSSLCSAEA